MNASKENARQALVNFNAIAKHLPQEAEEHKVSGAISKVREFLSAAERKLPSNAAFEADKKRRKKATA